MRSAMHQAMHPSDQSVRHSKKGQRALIITLSSLFLLFIICAVYVSDYYHASSEAEAVLSDHASYITIKENLQDHTYSILSDIPENEEVGLIFYPGGKVEYTAYLPLLTKCAESGIDCFLLKMPFNLAVLAPGAAESVIAAHPEITTWILAGHSLGGSMAADYTSKHPDEVSALVLLASYSISDLSKEDIDVVCVYGTNDQVMNAKNYEKDKVNLPSDFTEVIIPGGCHAYFGSYGFQKGDGTPSISPEEQIELTVDAILSLLQD